MNSPEYADSGWEQQRRTGRFEIAPYLHEETEAWLTMVGNSSNSNSQEQPTTFELLEARRLAAFSSGDYEEILKIQAEARALDGWDDTDPRYAHLINDCMDNIRNIMKDFG